MPGLVALPKNSFPAEHMAAHAARNVRRSAQGRALKPFSWPLLSAATAISLGRCQTPSESLEKPSKAFKSLEHALENTIKINEHQWKSMES